MFERDSLFIGGQFVPPTTRRTLDVVSPSTEEVIGRVPAAGDRDIDQAVTAARQAFDEGTWPRLPLDERLATLERLAQRLEARRGDILSALTAELGTPVSRGAGQAFALPTIVRTFIECARTTPLEETREFRGTRALVLREAVGVVGAIVPWNGPLFVMLAKAVPALIAGCTVVGKPAEETPLSAYLLAECAADAGFPPGVLSLLAADRAVSERLVRHPGVDAISFTGSTGAGRKIAAICGEQIKRCSLELGGKSAAIVLDDADLTGFAATLMNAGTVGSCGQMCMALTRVLVSAERHDEVVDAIVAELAKLVVGDPADPATDVGPLISARQRARVEGYIAIGRGVGATVAHGGGRPPGLDRGWYVEPTLFTDVDNSMRIAQEEIFGPVISVIRYRDVDDAVALANDSVFGLDGAVFTSDIDRGLAIARRVRTGTFNINDFRLGLNVPFGGYKCSGIGREYGPEGLAEFFELKTVNLPGSGIYESNRG